jgi:succinate dehydrogenase hydrophobic anchor subunit
MFRPVSDRVLGLLIALGAVGISILTNRMRSDIDLQNQLATPVWTTILVIFDLLTLSAVLVWGWSGKRRPWLWAVIITSVINITMLLLATSADWLGGTAFHPSPSLQLLVYGVDFVWFVAVPLAGYRWLALRFPGVALVAYTGWVVFFSVATVPVERGLLAAGVYIFGHGYTMTTDILWGVLMYGIALGLLLLLEQWQIARGSARNI